MNAAPSRHFDMLAARAAYAEGRNVTEMLRAQKGVAMNTPDIIETAYDLQAGSYVAQASDDPARTRAYAQELAAHLGEHLQPTDRLLDIGTGELTTLSPLVEALAVKPAAIYAFDISWSRLHEGAAYARQHMAADFARLTTFVADIGAIPLRDKSIDIVTSSHALEPNGGNLEALLRELFRVAVRRLVLFEPCYEINTDEGRRRMERLGYIRNLDGVAQALGGTLIERRVIRHVANPLNPTACFVIAPPGAAARPASADLREAEVFSVPGTNHPLSRVDDFWFSNDTGLCYPTLKSIPVLKPGAAILASSLCR